MRETLFNWLAPYIEGARVLDAFAGSGALGFEALSRGARFALFMDNSSVAVAQLKQSSQLLQSGAQIHQGNVIDFFNNRGDAEHRSFDIVFLDPPFDLDLLQTAVTALDQSGLVSEGGMVYIEQPRSQQRILTSGHWKLHREKSLGEVHCQLFQLDNSDTDGKLSPTNK